MNEVAKYRSGPLVSVVIMVVAFVATMVAHVVRFGYDYGNSDQDELLPAVFRVLSNNELFANDWLVSFQTSTFNVRTPAIHLVATLSDWLGTFDAVLLLYVLSAGATFFAIYRIADLSGLSDRSVWTPWIAGFIVFVLSKGFALGGNDVMNTMYVPSMTGWAAATWAVYFWLQDRPTIAALLSALTVPLQALIGLQTALLLGLSGLVLFVWTRDRRHLIMTLQFSLIFAVFAALPVIAFVSGQGPSSDAAAPGSPFLEILARIRAPHHFIPSHFSPRSFFKFGLLALAGVTSLILLPKGRRKQQLVSILLSILAICLFSYLFTEWAPVEVIVKLQLFRLTVYAKIIFIVVAVSYTVSIVESRFLNNIPALNKFRKLSGAVLFAVLIVSLLFLPSQEELEYRKRAASDWGSVEMWALQETEPGAVFLVEPSNSHFRSNAQRAIFVNYKAVPFGADDLNEWLRRLQIQTGLDTIPERVQMTALDSAYNSLSRQDLRRIASINDIDFVIRANPIRGANPIYTKGVIRVYDSDSLAGGPSE